VKNAQEAHEAIRPAGDAFQHPSDVASATGSDQSKLYELIWKRTVACQMEDSRGQSVKLSIATSVDGRALEFAVTGNTITFPGFLRAYVEGSDDPTQELEQRERPLPPVTEGESLAGDQFEPRGHETQPPARFTEASLVKRLEDLGVGRPSTYASILSTIQQRGYVWKKGSALVPSFKAFAVVQLLEKHFSDLVDYAFTAHMEDELDAIAAGRQEAVPWLKRFYFGIDSAAGNAASKDSASGEKAAGAKNSKDSDGKAPATGLALGLRTLVAERLNEIDARAINSLLLGKDDQGRDILVRVGRYGPYLQRQDDTASIPEDLPPDEVTLAKAIQLLDAPSGDRMLGADPASTLPIYVRSGRFGAYVQLGEAGGKEKPRTGSLLKSMTPATMTLEDALQMLSLPRVVGTEPASQLPITAQLGRYGPYISTGKDSRSLEKEEDVFSVTEEQALALFAQPKTRGRRKANEPIKELGKDEFSGGVITLREGRFGLYVTDGETNASLSKGDSPEGIDNARAQELLHQRRERAPTQKKKKTKKKAGGAAAKAAPSVTAEELDELDGLDGAGSDEAGSESNGAPAAKRRPPKKLAAKKAGAKKVAAKSADKTAAPATGKSSKPAPKSAAPEPGAGPKKSGKGGSKSSKKPPASKTGTRSAKSLT
jgi:DNA topoisomerase-1